MPPANERNQPQAAPAPANVNPAAPPKPEAGPIVGRFKLLKGRHIGTDGTVYEQGDVFDSDIDLVERFNAPGMADQKFERAAPTDRLKGAHTTPRVQGTEKPHRDTNRPPQKQPPNFNVMTSAQLREYAQAEEIDISSVPPAGDSEKSKVDEKTALIELLKK